jgi:TolB protein
MLSDSSADLEGPRLSRDGKKLVYQARLVDQSIELRLTNIEDQSTRAIYKTEPGMSTGFFSGPNWSPDGSQIVFASKASGNADIYVINSDGSALKKLTDDPLPDLSPVFSADGKEIFFVRDIYGKAKLFRMNADGSDARLLTGKEGYEMSPGISPDGRTLLFSGDRVDGKSKALDIFSVQLGDLSSEKILASRPSHDGMAVFSPDGRKVAFTSLGDGNREIYVMNADGSGLFRLTRNKAEDTYPTFSADGRGVIFSSNREGKFQIYQVALPN